MIKGLLEGKRWAALWKALPEYYVPGFIMTLKISIVGLLVALLLGIVFGTFSTMKFKPAKILARIYVEFLQNTPLALQILFYYSVLPLLFSNSGFRIPKFVLGVIGVGYTMELTSRRLSVPVSRLCRRDSRKPPLPRAFRIWKPCTISFYPRQSASSCRRWQTRH